MRHSGNAAMYSALAAAPPVSKAHVGPRGSSTPSASGDASALPGAVSLGGDADGDDVFDLDGGDADFGDEDEVLDLDSLADAS